MTRTQRRARAELQRKLSGSPQVPQTLRDYNERMRLYLDHGAYREAVALFETLARHGDTLTRLVDVVKTCGATAWHEQTLRTTAQFFNRCAVEAAIQIWPDVEDVTNVTGAHALSRFVGGLMRAQAAKEGADVTGDHTPSQLVDGLMRAQAQALQPREPHGAAVVPQNDNAEQVKTLERIS